MVLRMQQKARGPKIPSALSLANDSEDAMQG